jgi:Holliday junction resolvasome RuvABC endonuclease subunit
MTARILGIDAGFVATGLVVVELGAVAAGSAAASDRILAAVTVRTDATGAKRRGLRVADSDAERCQVATRAILSLAREWDVAGVVAELPHGGAQGARANRAMGLATGVVAASVEALGLPAEWVTPAAAKKAATGRADASKADVQAAVERRFAWAAGTVGRYAWEREHVSDAAAAVLAAAGGTLVRALRPRASA